MKIDDSLCGCFNWVCLGLKQSCKPTQIHFLSSLMIGYAVFCIAEWDLGKSHCFTIGMEKDSSDLHVSVGETLVFP